MTEEKLQDLLGAASRTWRVPPAPRVEEMWSAIETAHFSRRRLRLTPNWWMLVTGVAAALILGVAIGRFTAIGDPAATLAVMPPPAGGDPGAGEPYQRATTQLLGESAVLFSALPDQAQSGGSNARFATQAAELLLTTRLLLDSPVAGDRRLRDLLDDLELVLAQVAHLRAVPTHGAAELDLINEALQQREVVPRIRIAVASLTGDN
ncbi:MAG: hypothetical protein ACT4R6_10735 [Gemmatimonadaceae bacterium]